MGDGNAAGNEEWERLRDEEWERLRGDGARQMATGACRTPMGLWGSGGGGKVGVLDGLL